MLDDSVDDVLFCEGCNEFVCEKCWNKFRPHRENKPGQNGIPHQRVALDIKEKMQVSMAEPMDEGDQTKQHQDDEDTTWFGLDKDENEEPILSEYRRYAAIMMDCMQSANETRHPRLVSFIGETGKLNFVTRV